MHCVLEKLFPLASALERLDRPNCCLRILPRPLMRYGVELCLARVTVADRQCGLPRAFRCLRRTKGVHGRIPYRDLHIQLRSEGLTFIDRQVVARTNDSGADHLPLLIIELRRAGDGAVEVRAGPAVEDGIEPARIEPVVAA